MAVAGVTALEARSALLLQKIWRGELARRIFSELYFNACVADLRQQGLDAEDEHERASMGLSDVLSHPGSEEPEIDTSLEEAHLEALSGSHFINANRSEENAIVPSDAREAAISSLHPPVASKVDGTGGEPRLTGADSGDSQSLGTTHPPVLKKRLGGATGGYRFAVGPEGLGELAELQFTKEMADEMDLTALQELASVLSRIIVARNKNLMSLLQKRDELLHEHECRELLVGQLLEQVSESGPQNRYCMQFLGLREQHRMVGKSRGLKKGQKVTKGRRHSVR